MGDVPFRPFYRGRDRYRTVRCIGSGAMGVVLQAQNLDRDDADRALKLLRNPAFDQRFEAEAEALSRLRHRHIVPMYEFFRDGTDHVIAMAYVDGESLAQRIERERAVSVTLALRIMAAILSALDHAHQAGIIHRDLKASNILLDRSEDAWLCDFGIARHMGQRRRLTAAGITLGTAEYMSPEQIRAPHEVDHRSDVYSAGIVLYEMLTGGVPFPQTAADPFAVLQQHLNAEPPRPKAGGRPIDPALERIVLKALRKPPDRRYQGCGDMLADIAPFLQRADIEPPVFRRPASPAPAPPAPPPPSRRPSQQYQVYEHRTRGYTAVKDGFSWAALFGNVLWMFGKGLLLQGFLWLAGYLAIAAIVDASGSTPVVLLALLCALLMLVMPGLKGNTWCAEHLRQNGYALKRKVQADTATAAVAEIRRGA